MAQQSPLPLRARVRVRRLTARRPWLVHVVVFVVALVSARSVQNALTEAEAARRSWGPVADVLVATQPVTAGTPVAAAHLVRRAMPAAVLSGHPLTHPAPGAVLITALDTGAVLTDSDVDTGRIARLAIGRPAVMPILEVGDRVRIVTDDGNGTARSTDATIVDLDDSIVTVDVAINDAPALALAIGRHEHDAGFVLLRRSTKFDGS